MPRFILTLCFQIFLINNVLSQYSFGPSINIPSQQIATAPTQISTQQLINYLLSNTNTAPLPDRLEILTTAVQQMPPRKNKVYLADVLKQSALQNLLVASSVCGEATTAPVATEYASPLRRKVMVATAPDYASPLTSYAAPLPRRNVIVANANEYATPLSREFQPPLSRRNVVVANIPNETPLVANRELLSLLPRDLLTSLVAGDYNMPNRAARFQYV